MTSDERKIWLDLAIEVIEKVHSDLCRESTQQVSRAATNELTSIIQQLRSFSSSISKEGLKHG